MDWHESPQSLYRELKELEKKIDQANEQITIVRVEMAEHRVKISEGRKFQSGIWGLVGGGIAAAVVAVVDILFRK